MTQNPQSQNHPQTQNPQFQAQNPYSMTPPQAVQPAGQYSAQQGHPQQGQPGQPGQQGYYQSQPQGYPAQAPQQMQQAPFARGAIISARNLHKSYGNNPVLRNVSLDIYPGESVAIMGPSGSGKTTLLHALSGIIKLDAGSVLFNGPAGQVAVESLSERERTSLRANSFGFVFQQGLLVPELTAEENVSLAAMIAGVPRQQARSISADLLNRLGLGQMLDRRMGEMSGGQAQRVAIARSQVNGAPVTFADEPTGALDSKTAREVMALLLTMIPQQGKTLLVVTHDPNVAAACSRVVYLQDGQIVSDQRNNQGGVPASQNHAQSFGAQSQAGA
ncbi:macrolide ABC transporter ATP-binding protein [Rothia sp. HMSC066G07]|uniref:ABC transporter ATP-binding protein n=1 Tax=Rothia mucilaginosa TaxID=43675 RepID=A0A291DI34_9MICC|nr:MULTISPECIES: ABC transporter ATP-binding protein [Rothia]ATF63949.1 ABC transporter ATP-binding protein [Rothia mucilaginosa]OFP76218.1 macrolide ABC transporter ATP-binding protein [Rothia sp. HMSC066G07]